MRASQPFTAPAVAGSAPRSRHIAETCSGFLPRTLTEHPWDMAAYIPARAAPPVPKTSTLEHDPSSLPAFRKACTTPSQSVLAPRILPSLLARVFTAPISRAGPSRESAWDMAATLCGTVTFIPRMRYSRMTSARCSVSGESNLR